MSKKKLNTHQIANELKASRFFSGTPVKRTQPTQKSTSVSTSKVTPVREPSRMDSRENLREPIRTFPSRDEIQEFSFRLRDSLKVKVQAEVPHEWQDELEGIAREL